MCATQKSKQSANRLVEPSTDLQLIADSSTKMEEQINILLGEYSYNNIANDGSVCIKSVTQIRSNQKKQLKYNRITHYYNAWNNTV